MTDEEMGEMNSLVAMDNRLYSKTEDAGMQIAAIVTAVTEDLTSKPEKVSLKNLDSVIAATKRYIASCLRSGVLPSKSGHARCLGVSRQFINRFLSQSSIDNPVAEYLRMLYDAFAEAMEMASLTGKVHPIISIFILKSVYGFSENADTPEASSNPLGDPIDAEELYQRIMEQYGDLPPE